MLDAWVSISFTFHAGRFKALFSSTLELILLFFSACFVYFLLYFVFFRHERDQTFGLCACECKKFIEQMELVVFVYSFARLCIHSLSLC